MRTPNGLSIQAWARLAGGLWLLVILTGIISGLAVRAVYVPGDAATTASRLVASEWMFRIGFVTNIASYAAYLGVTVILCLLLLPVSRMLAWLSAFLGITGTAVGMAASVVQVVPLLLLNGPTVSTVPAEQLRSLALVAFAVNSQGMFVGWIFFGLQCITLGYLIARSGFIPRVLGLMLAFGGSTYVLGCALALLSPRIGGPLFPLLAGAAFIGEGSLGVWLLTKGLNAAKWDEMSRIAPSA